MHAHAPRSCTCPFLGTPHIGIGTSAAHAVHQLLLCHGAASGAESRRQSRNTRVEHWQAGAGATRMGRLGWRCPIRQVTAGGCLGSA